MELLINNMTHICLEHNHNLRSKHISAMVKNNKIITKYVFNSIITNKIMKLNVGTSHAEMLSVLELYRTICSSSDISYNSDFDIMNFFQKKFKRTDRECVLCCVGKQKYKKLLKKLSQYSIIVLRVGLTGELLNSKPCMDCLKVLKMIGIKKVYYSDENGNIIVEKIKNMESNHVCRFSKYLNRK
jgi:hypothetical protein